MSIVGTMGRPKNSLGVIDLMIGFPSPERRSSYQFAGLKDDGSKDLEMPAGFLFGDVPEETASVEAAISTTLAAMDEFDIEQGLFALDDVALAARHLHPDRVRLIVNVDPHKGSAEIDRVRELHATHGLSAIGVFQAGLVPLRSIADPVMYPFHALAVELGLPLVANAGVPGPRFPMDVQHVRHVDDVCYDFPELQLVMRHGAEPWQELAVKLMLKWPNLGYMTSAFAPRYYPDEIIRFANTRGGDQIMYAGYYPMGLELSRIFAELDTVDFRDDVWPRFLRTNAQRVFGL